MIVPSYKIATATCEAAGKGLFVTEPVSRGSVICAPDKIDRVYSLAEKAKFTPDEDASSIRWFERNYTVSLDWPDECYINHSFEPSGLWHLGFVFAARDLEAGEEVTVDYCLIVDDGEVLPFKDEATGREIVGMGWRENMLHGAKMLRQLFE